MSHACSRLGHPDHRSPDHRHYRGGSVASHIPSACDPGDAPPGHRRGHRGRAADRHGARPARVGERQPEAGQRLLRDRVSRRRSLSMSQHAVLLAAGNSTSTFGWILGYVIGGVIVLVVVALVVPILLLAKAIGDEAPKIHAELTKAVHNTAALAGLRTTIDHATIIIGGLQRGRARLGG